LLSRALGDGRHEVRLGDERRLLAVHRDGERRAVFAPDGQLLVTLHDPIAHAGDHAGETGRLSAPMPGKIVAIAVEAGQAVRRGQALAVLEAMKMEHTITAPRDGVVEALLVRAGDTVAEGSELLRLSGDE
ncbi:acetyl-CoA carboxylase biotin carboxyl carrier protein subunit, partial [Rubrivivax gelatinosus]